MSRLGCPIELVIVNLIFCGISLGISRKTFAFNVSATEISIWRGLILGLALRGLLYYIQLWNESGYSVSWLFERVLPNSEAHHKLFNYIIYIDLTSIFIITGCIVLPLIIAPFFSKKP